MLEHAGGATNGAPFVWGNAEIVSLAFGIAFAVAGCFFHRRSLSQERFGILLANGIALGPLAMILGDPINKLLGNPIPFDLLQAVMTEARATLWWAACMASLGIAVSMFPQRPTD